MKKLILTLLAQILLFLFYTACAASDFTIENGVLTAYSGSGGRVVIPEGVTAIGEYAFSWQTKMTSVTIPNSVETIGERAFLHCTGLKSVELPGSVISFGTDVFGECGNLTSIFVDEQNAAYASYDGILYDREMESVIACPAGKTGSIVLPDGVVRVGAYAFNKCTALTGVALSDHVVTVGDSSFFGCTSLKEISLPSGLQVIGDNAFEDCRSLQRIKLPDSVVSLGKCAFYKCASLSEVRLSAGLVGIAERAFNNCPRLTHVTIPDGVQYIDALAFCDCTALSGIDIPDTVVYMEANAFDGCNGLTIYCNLYSYAECYAQDLAVPYAQLRLPIDAEVPHGVKVVEQNAFENCAFAAVLLPKEVETVADGAFAGCAKLRQVTVEGTRTLFVGDPFPNSTGLVIFCKADSEACIYAQAHSIRYITEE